MIDDFEGDGESWTWKAGDHVMVKVDVRSPSDDAGGYQVYAVNRCWYGTEDDLAPPS